MNNVEQIINNIVDWLKKNVNLANSKGVVFGLSGGIDSAVIAGLSKLAFNENALGIIMPINSSPQDEIDARIVADALKLNVEKVDLTEVFNSFIKLVDKPKGLAESNVKPRLRMTTLYYYAQSNNYLVLGSSNRSEFNVGYFTKFGDSGADLLPLANFYKSEIYEIANYLKIPKEVINKAPSAGLWEGQTDENEMGVTYDEIESYFKNKPINEESKNIIKNLHLKSEHKRKFPPIYR